MDITFEFGFYPMRRCLFWGRLTLISWSWDCFRPEFPAPAGRAGPVESVQGRQYYSTAPASIVAVPAQKNDGLALKRFK